MVCLCENRCDKIEGVDSVILSTNVEKIISNEKAL